MLNFRTNNELKFTDNIGYNGLLFGLKKHLATELEYFEVQSLGGTSITTFEAVKLDKLGLVCETVSLNQALIILSGSTFISDVNEVIALQPDSIYYFTLIDNDGNSYFSEPFLTYSSAVFIPSQNANAGGSLNFQTTNNFHLDNANLAFGLKEFSIYQLPFLAFNDLANDTEILTFKIFCVDKFGTVQSEIVLNNDLITYSNGIFFALSAMYDESLHYETIYYFEITTASEVYFSEYFTTGLQFTTRLVVSADFEKLNFYDILTSADQSGSGTWDASQL